MFDTVPKYASILKDTRTAFDDFKNKQQKYLHNCQGLMVIMR